jgi:hypothetical protein
MKKSKVVGEENHVLTQGGDLAGLYTINVAEIKKKYALWPAAKVIVEQYQMLHPQEMKDIYLVNQEIRETNQSATGSNASGSMRHALSIPQGLMFVIEELEPKMFTEKANLHKFMSNFPALTACKTQ